MLRCSLTHDSTKITNTIVIVIDVLSTHESLKTKNGTEMVTVIAKIIRDDGTCPKNLQTDMGKKFYNANVQILLKKHNINYYSTYSVMKSSNIDVTPTIAKFLNTVYSTVKAVALPLFKVDDSVRVNKFKTIFEKRYTPNWTEMFKIVKAQRTNHVTYLLEDYRGKPIAEGFYEYELHRVVIPTYRIQRLQRDIWYVGQTGKKLKSRIQEHRRHINSSSGTRSVIMNHCHLIMISIEHEEFSAMLPRRRPNRIFTAPKSCSVVPRFKKSHRIVSRKITKFVTRRTIEDFIQLQLVVQSISSTTHSYIIQPIISCNGNLLSSLFIVLKETSNIQPLDVNGFRIWKNFAKKFFRYCFMIRKSFYTNERPKEFENPVEFSFDKSSRTCDIKGYSNRIIIKCFLIKCFWYKKSLCLKYFFIDHYCNIPIDLTNQ
ncbi:hypothetical protein ALC53_12883 [Atta colombica]|uniref:Integrase catalytic domain-containing protein n=1 Tax=Atta colombica TaxID=520822 RepID=A0A151HYC7_9HYME|nr:hypothetical protein ALC53_12883 [Atta colombica]